MPSGYFHRVTQETPTRFWINNPTGPDLEQAIAAGAINCTTNPSYCSKLLASEPDYIRGVIARIVTEIEDDDAAAERVYDKVSLRVMRRFLPLYKASSGASGYVTMQDDPRRDEDTDCIIKVALRRHDMSENFMAKIPVIPAGIEAMEELVARNVPLCATECFSIDQTIAICEAYRRAADKSGNHPLFFVTHITGIFDQYLAAMAQGYRMPTEEEWSQACQAGTTSEYFFTEDGKSISIAPDVLAQAGCAIARKEYRLLKERGYETTMLGGGARGLQHFTEMVGGDIHVTINWSTALELIEADSPVVSRIDAETPQAVVDELSEKFQDFRKAYYEGGLPPEEFADFGPLQLFRNMFLAGYTHLLREIAASRRRVS